MLQSMNFLIGKCRGRVGEGNKTASLAPVILGPVPRILWQRVSNLVNKFALLLHKCWFTQDSRNKSENDRCWERVFSLVAREQRSVAVGNKVMDTRLPQPVGCGDKYDVSWWCWERRVSAFSQSGRSMIEMLGVLAIIGVLSVGGIAGYSKAMMKYKINKMTEEYTMLMTGLMEYEESLFKTYADAEERNLAQFIIDAKLVPETWKLVNQQFISDSLGNTINAYVDVAKTGVRFSSDVFIVSSGENKDSEYAYQLCMALAHDVVYPLSANADFALLFINNEAMPNYGVYTVYSKSCRNSDFSEVKCMADMTLSEISTICKSCVQQSACNVGIGWR